MATSAKLHPARRRIATFDDYAEAERAVERLTSHGFPVQLVAIVGRDLRSVEQITGRLTVASAAWRGALSGALPGALIGWIFGLLAWVSPLIGALLIDPVYGARPQRRYIAHEVETRIARALLREAAPDSATARLDLGEVGELVVSHEVPAGAAA
jgi:hypothetical protein